VLRGDLAGDRGVVRRFERGAVAAARIVHPNVVRTTGLERLADGLPFCAMELLIGLDLADTLAYSGALPVERAVRIATGAAEGLAAAHETGVVHLDVKPENVFLVHEADGRELVKIIDFGLAAPRGDAGAVVRVDAACSTPEYMAPEQARGVPPTPAMDVYSLGLMLREMVTGRAPGAAVGSKGAPHPGAGRAPGAAMGSQGGAGAAGARAPRAGHGEVPPRIEQVIERATAALAAERFTTMAELRAALLEATEPVPAPRSARRSG